MQIENNTGKLIEVNEAVLLDQIQNVPRSVVCFYLEEFEYCQLALQILRSMAEKHYETKFVAVKATESSWFVTKFHIKTLPSFICFVNGKLVKKFVGLYELGDGNPTEYIFLQEFSKLNVVQKKKDEDKKLLKKQAAKDNIWGYQDSSSIDSDDSRF